MEKNAHQENSEPKILGESYARIMWKVKVCKSDMLYIAHCMWHTYTRPYRLLSLYVCLIRSIFSWFTFKVLGFVLWKRRRPILPKLYIAYVTLRSCSYLFRYFFFQSKIPKKRAETQRIEKKNHQLLSERENVNVERNCWECMRA